MHVLTIDPESSILDALKQMQSNLVKHMVVALENKPVGVVTERDINRFLENDTTSRALNEIPIKHVMQKNVISIVNGPDDHFVQCANKMETFKIGSIILVDESGALAGIVTKTDITKAFSVTHGGRFQVKEFMTKEAVTCRKSDSLKFALGVMNRNKISRLVVTNEDGIPKGLISTNTFLNHSDYFSSDSAKSRDYLFSTETGEKLTVADLMTDETITVTPEEDLATAASIMIKRKISGIPVVDSEKNLLGVVSKFDLVCAFSNAGSNEDLKSQYKDLY